MEIKTQPRHGSDVLDRKSVTRQLSLMIELRKQGVNKLDQVREAHMEADGSVSVIRTDQAGDN